MKRRLNNKTDSPFVVFRATDIRYLARNDYARTFGKFLQTKISPVLFDDLSGQALKCRQTSFN